MIVVAQQPSAKPTFGVLPAAIPSYVYPGADRAGLPDAKRCPRPDRDAFIARPVPSLYPMWLDAQPTRVKVTLDATGAITDVGIYSSSHSPYLDRQAVAAARSQSYAPECVRAVPTAGSYIFRYGPPLR